MPDFFFFKKIKIAFKDSIKLRQSNYFEKPPNIDLKKKITPLECIKQFQIKKKNLTYTLK